VPVAIPASEERGWTPTRATELAGALGTSLPPLLIERCAGDNGIVKLSWTAQNQSFKSLIKYYTSTGSTWVKSQCLGTERLRGCHQPWAWAFGQCPHPDPVPSRGLPSQPGWGCSGVWGWPGMAIPGPLPQPGWRPREVAGWGRREGTMAATPVLDSLIHHALHRSCEL